MSTSEFVFEVSRSFIFQPKISTFVLFCTVAIFPSTYFQHHLQFVLSSQLLMFILRHIATSLSAAMVLLFQALTHTDRWPLARWVRAPNRKSPFLAMVSKQKPLGKEMLSLRKAKGRKDLHLGRNDAFLHYRLHTAVGLSRGLLFALPLLYLTHLPESGSNFVATK